MNKRLFSLTLINFCLLGITIGYIGGFFVFGRDTNPNTLVSVDNWDKPSLDQALKFTVAINASFSQLDGFDEFSSSGSGIIIDPSGYILTNEHIIHNSSELTVTLYNKKSYTAECVGYSIRDDLAVLKIDAPGLTAAAITPIDQLTIGQAVATLGNPLGTASDGIPIATFGQVNRLGQRLSSNIDPDNSRFYDNMIQTDAKTLPGNSGGPLIDTKGQVVGITTALGIGEETGKQFGFAIILDNYNCELINIIKLGLPVEHAILGINIIPVSTQTSRKLGLKDLSGVQVASILPKTPAWNAGLKKGDIICTIDEQSVFNPDDLLSKLHRCRPEQKISLQILRFVPDQPRQPQKICISVNLITRNVLLTSGHTNNK